jgi:hypothetical protein
MTPRIRHRLATGIIAGFASTIWVIAEAPTASADTSPLPKPPGFSQPNFGILDGSYQYYYDFITTNPPAANDARGVRVVTNADPDAQSFGLPGSELGNSAPRNNNLTPSSARGDMTGGLASPQPISTGINIGAGNESAVLEDPDGQPPQDVAGRGAQPAGNITAGPARSVLTLEDPHGQPPQDTTSPEAQAPINGPAGPGNPGPTLEDPYGRPPGSS